jgi:hypothetical protein
MIRITMNKSAFVLLIISCVFMLTTCQFKGCRDESKSELNTTDTLFLNQWRKEKAEKTKLITSYENSIRKLQIDKDSLLKDVQIKKNSIASFRFKTAHYEDLLREHLASADTLNRNEAELLLDSLLISQSKSDTACDETINQLEIVIANRNTVIDLHERVEFNLKEIQKTNELETTFLTAQLNDSKKDLRKKTRQNKLLSGGLILLSGIVASLLITQHLK